jgi:hypothetical protein
MERSVVSCAAFTHYVLLWLLNLWERCKYQLPLAASNTTVTTLQLDMAVITQTLMTAHQPRSTSAAQHVPHPRQDAHLCVAVSCLKESLCPSAQELHYISVWLRQQVSVVQ